MKKLPACLTACVAACFLTHCAPSPMGAGGKPAQESHSGILAGIQAPTTVRYAGKTWTARYSAASPAASEAMVEYFLPGEGPGNWSRMVALRLLAKDTTPTDYAATMGSVSSSPGKAYHLPGGEAGYDTLIPRGGTGGLEFSIFRIAPLKGSPGVKSLQYAEVIPQQRMLAIGVDGLKGLTASHRGTIKSATFPSISLK